VQKSGPDEARTAWERGPWVSSQPLAGFGDAATIRADAQAASISVLKGDLVSGFGIVVTSGPDASQSITDVASRVLSRIP
jgi:hypothetical protein